MQVSADPMSSMEKGGRSEEASQAAELALVCVEKKESKSKRERAESHGKKSDPGRPLKLEDIPREPEGRPEVRGPKQLEPLFNEEQVRRAEELEAKAPMLQSRRKTTAALENSGWDMGLGGGEPSGSNQELEVMAGKGVGMTPPGIQMPPM